MIKEYLYSCYLRELQILAMKGLYIKQKHKFQNKLKKHQLEMSKHCTPAQGLIDEFNVSIKFSPILETLGEKSPNLATRNMKS